MSKLYSSISQSSASLFPEDAANKSNRAFSYKIANHSKQCHKNQCHPFIHYRTMQISTFAVPFIALPYFLTMCFARSRCPFNKALRKGCWTPSFIGNNIGKVSSFKFTVRVYANKYVSVYANKYVSVYVNKYVSVYVNEYVSVNEYLNGFIKRSLFYIHTHSTWGTNLPFRWAQRQGSSPQMLAATILQCASMPPDQVHIIRHQSTVKKVNIL